MNVYLEIPLPEAVAIAFACELAQDVLDAGNLRESTELAAGRLALGAAIEHAQAAKAWAAR